MISVEDFILFFKSMEGGEVKTFWVNLWGGDKRVLDAHQQKLPPS